MRISLVLATVDRTSEVDRLLASLAEQKYRDFEVVVVDQNPDERLAGIIASYATSLSIARIRAQRGLSKARNVGLARVFGDVIGFPDDDCWYSTDVLAMVARTLEAHPDWGGLTGRLDDGSGAATGMRFQASAGRIGLGNVWTCGVSAAMFLRKEVVMATGHFDEELGLGSGTRFGSGEETDYLVRAIRRGSDLRYSPDLIVYHPNPIAVFDQRARRRARAYGAGMGRVMRKHGFGVHKIAMALVRPAAGVLISSFSGRLAKAGYHWNVFRGRLEGLLAEFPLEQDVSDGR